MYFWIFMEKFDFSVDVAEQMNVCFIGFKVILNLIRLKIYILLILLTVFKCTMLCFILQ